MNASGKALQLLLVEDSEEDTFFFRRVLDKSEVPNVFHRATDGQEAIDLMGNPEDPLRPDIIFLDLKMPRLSGFDVLRWLREHDLLRGMTVVVLSGSPSDKDRTLALELGASDYLVKPLRVEPLKEMLSRVTAAPGPSGENTHANAH